MADGHLVSAVYISMTTSCSHPCTYSDSRSTSHSAEVATTLRDLEGLYNRNSTWSCC